jgi:polyhydroxybutyrate depolymerase
MSMFSRIFVAVCIHSVYCCAGQTAAPRPDSDFQVQHGGLTRKYRVHVPPSYYESEKPNPFPAVIYLHGGGGSIRAAYNDGMDKASDRLGFILIVPAGTGPIPEILLTWNGGAWGPSKLESCCAYAFDHNIDDVGFISKVIVDAQARFRIDENRIYATGISNGGLMSYRLACELAGTIAAVAAVAPPGTPSSCSPARPVPVMHIHGTADPCAPYNGGIPKACLGTATHQMQTANEMVAIWRKHDRCSAASTVSYRKGNVTCASYGACEDASEVEFCTIEGGGHAWPSGAQYLPPARIGPVSYDISFDQIWAFFQKHPKASTRQPQPQ